MIKKYKRFKYLIGAKICFYKNDANHKIYSSSYYNGNFYLVLTHADVDILKVEQSIINDIAQYIEDYQGNGSSWILKDVEELYLKIIKYNPLKGSSYIPTPINLRRTHSIVNPRNIFDNKCFMWAVLAKLYPAKHNPQRISNYIEYSNLLNFNDISFPVKLSDIAKFENLNKISINVFGFENNEIVPLKLTKLKLQRHVNLMLLTNGDGQHYSVITNLDRLLASRNLHRGRTHFCNYCLHGFSNEQLLEQHIPYCSIHMPTRVLLPTERNKILEFKDYSKTLSIPYVIYCNFQYVRYNMSDSSPADSSIKKHQRRQVLWAFAYKVISFIKCADEDRERFDLKIYRGPNAIKIFIKKMLILKNYLTEKIKLNVSMRMTEMDKDVFGKASLCHICNKKLGLDKVRDHNHVNGTFRGAAHTSCNLNFKTLSKIPIIFNNLSDYDSHVIIKGISENVKKRLFCIPNKMDHYISFSLGNLCFLDSLQFLNAPVGQLIGTLEKDKFLQTIEYLSLRYPTSSSSELLESLLKWHIFPKYYIDHPDKFHEVNFPSKEAFYDVVKEEHICDNLYEDALNIWNKFKIKNIGYYQDLYMEINLLFLADLFQNYRNFSLEYYGLDPAHFYTASGFAWEAALKMTHVQLELFTDLDMYLFVEAGQRGGITIVSNRYAEANNPYISNYDSSKPCSYIVYLDANNLYGWSMSQYLPVKGFRWLSEEEIKNIDVCNARDDADTGYILEVDLDYPPELHESHNDFPLAPDYLSIEYNMLSPYVKNLQTILNLQQRKLFKKLVPNLFNKEKYILHYRNLKLYISLGMKLKRIHRILAFEQSAWLKPYIDFNTEKRKGAKSNFESNYFKTMNNVVYGKTIENMRKRVDIKLVNNINQLEKLASKPNLKTFKIFNENLVAVEMRKIKTLLNKPIYLGFSILDISKSFMYEFFYNHIKVIYKDSVKLLFSDTDSFCLYVKTPDIYEDMKKNGDLYDFSNYHVSHKCYDDTNLKKIGLFKDECNGVALSSYVALRSKMYSLKYSDDSVKNIASGVHKSVKNSLTHNDYVTCLFNPVVHNQIVSIIKYYNQNIFTVSQNRNILSPYDDKRYILNDSVSSLAYGHYKINRQAPGYTSSLCC